MSGDEAEFIAKLNFGRLIPGKKIVIVDDLLAAGSSISKVVKAVEKLDGQILGAAVVVRRSRNVTAETCKVPKLITLAEVDGSQSSPEDCELCAKRVPMTLRPGHGHEWIKEHPDYPVAK
jgi:orotate phosphoribosyltransferase